MIMLTHIQDIGFRAAEYALTPPPADEIAKILAILHDFHGPRIDPAHLLPPDDPAALRAALTVAAPSLAALAERLHTLLEEAHSAVSVPRAGLGHLDLDTRAAVLFALAVCLGSPTATDRIDRRVVWDIKVRAEKVKTGTVSTFSEHPYEADLHTDTQYFDHPERYMILYFITPAACGGGVSTVRDVDSVKQALADSEEGRWAMDFLSRQALPFRIPAIFTATGAAETVEVTFATIFGQRPAIRFRTDTLRKGLALHPASDTPDTRRALAILQAEIDRPAPLISALMPADSLNFINNHQALHGRSAFSDHHRHAWRIRVAEDNAPAPHHSLGRAA